MGTSPSSNQNSQVLPSDSNNQNQRLLHNPNIPSRVNDSDISLLVNDQPQIKKIFAIKNPVYLKRNSLSLERDSSNRNIFYINFLYDAIVDMNINIYFNATRNLKKFNQEENNSKNSKIEKENSKSSKSVNINNKSDFNKNEYSGINIIQHEHPHPQSSNDLHIHNNTSTLTLNYIPSPNFMNKILTFNNCPRGHNNLKMC
jgi:hypothetical protein